MKQFVVSDSKLI